MTKERTETEEKAAYAALLLKEGDTFKAALLLFPDNTNRALRVANEWPLDKEVIAEQSRLMAKDGGASFLPTKVDLAKGIWQRMQGTKFPTGAVIPTTAEEYAKLAKLYAEVQGFIEKPQTNVNVTTNFQRVVEVPVFDSEDDWEKAAQKQQTASLANARTRH